MIFFQMTIGGTCLFEVSSPMFVLSTRQICKEDEKGNKLVDPTPHVEWWDNFSKCYAYQKGDMQRTNFTACLWTVIGVQRQSCIPASCRTWYKVVDC